MIYFIKTLQEELLYYYHKYSRVYIPTVIN